MRTYFIAIGLLIISFHEVAAQRACFSSEHLQNEMKTNPSLSLQLNNIEGFLQRQLSIMSSARLQGSVIKIPVVVHVLYHSSEENIPDEQVNNQIAMLNNCFRRTNPDTANTPARFKSLAAYSQVHADRLLGTR